MAENNVTLELMEKARQAKSAAELQALAKENGMEMTEEKAQEVFQSLHSSGELSDEELDNVAGGAGCLFGITCPKCGGMMWGNPDVPYCCEDCGHKVTSDADLIARF